MLMEVRNHLKVMFLSVKYNIMREMTNQITFMTNVVFMMLNNATFIIQWMILFNIKDNIGGYEINDVLVLWGLAASTFGVAHIFFRQGFNLPDLIMNGKLDSYLVQPKNVLVSVITSSTRTSAIGDVIYGYLILIILKFSVRNLLLFTLFSITGALILTAFGVIVGSISFWIVRGDIISGNLNSIMLSTATYPDGIFKGVVKVLLYTIIPVGFVNYIPVKTMIAFHLPSFLIIIGFTICIVSFAFYIFHKGLKRYTSSSLMIARI